MGETGQDGEGAAGRGNTGRWLRLALVLSLALNLLVVGLVAGVAARGGPMGRHGGMGDVGFGPLTGSLSREDRRALRERFEASAPDWHDERAAVRDDYLALATLLQAEPWDGAAAAAIIARQEDRGKARFRQGGAILVDYFGTLSPEARHEIGQRMAADLGPPD